MAAVVAKSVVVAVLVVFDGAMTEAATEAETAVTAAEVTGETELVVAVVAVGLETTDAYVLGRAPLDSTGTLDAESHSKAS